MKIQTLAVGELMTNCYILCDEQAKVCAVVDPGGEAERIAAAVEKEFALSGSDGYHTICRKKLLMGDGVTAFR